MNDKKERKKERKKEGKKERKYIRKKYMNIHLLLMIVIKFSCLTSENS